jgi:site-specific DNA-methyltransferase (adenine-specific)
MLYSSVENIDCMEGMKRYPAKYFDWCIADVPYGINVAKMAYTQETKQGVKQKNGKILKLNKSTYEIKDWDSKPPPQSYFDEVRRISKNQIIFGVEYVDWQGLGDGRIKWDKCVPDGVSFKGYEMAYCSAINHTEEIKLLWSGMMQAKSIEFPTIQQGNKKLNEKRIHPTQKPKILYQILFNMFLKRGDKIIDTHLGSGNSRIVAEKMGFHFKGFEIDRYYFLKQEERFLSEIAMPLFSIA